MQVLSLRGARALASYGERVPVVSLAAHAIYADACATYVCGRGGADEDTLRTALRADFEALFGAGLPFDPLAIALAGVNVARVPAPHRTREVVLALLIMALQCNADTSDAAVRVLLGRGTPLARAVSTAMVRTLARPATLEHDPASGREVWCVPTAGRAEHLAQLPGGNVGTLPESALVTLRDCLEHAWHAHAAHTAAAHVDAVQRAAQETARGTRHELVCIAVGGGGSRRPA